MHHNDDELSLDLEGKFVVGIGDRTVPDGRPDIAEVIAVCERHRMEVVAP